MAEYDDEFINKIIDFFRKDDFLDTLKEHYRYEISVACLSHSDFLSSELERLIECYGKSDN